MKMDKPVDIFRPLPTTVTNQVTTYDSREQFVLKFLQETLPPSDTKKIPDEMRKTFLFSKHRSKNSQRKQKKGSFSGIKKRILLNLNKKKEKELRYNDILPLYTMWLDYMKNLLGVENFSKLPTNPFENNWESVNQKIMKADYHGAKISVIRSKCPSLVGIHGIILQDTRNTFRVIGEDDRIRTIPKETTKFEMHLGDMTLEVFGKELCIRPAERSVRKFKNAQIPDL
ncbi:ribonuclease P protein subunit p29 [Belonocnema kinseyi]|uniref:ribonuclease P protein subunit p29 n=1 Tax=Belonocnema kinseyi TaxID=2817044 RepID=UPI00143D15B4|nr:ribonuclease P protein subunit p29 [Belonocnema kinseyi]